MRSNLKDTLLKEKSTKYITDINITLREHGTIRLFSTSVRMSLREVRVNPVCMLRKALTSLLFLFIVMI